MNNNKEHHVFTLYLLTSRSYIGQESICAQSGQAPRISGVSLYLLCQTDRPPIQTALKVYSTHKTEGFYNLHNDADQLLFYDYIPRDSKKRKSYLHPLIGKGISLSSKSGKLYTVKLTVKRTFSFKVLAIVCKFVKELFARCHEEKTICFQRKLLILYQQGIRNKKNSFLVTRLLCYKKVEEFEFCKRRTDYFLKIDCGKILCDLLLLILHLSRRMK